MAKCLVVRDMTLGHRKYTKGEVIELDEGHVAVQERRGYVRRDMQAEMTPDPSPAPQVEDDPPVPTPAKRGRGRPRKHPKPEEVAAT